MSIPRAAWTPCASFALLVVLAAGEAHAQSIRTADADPRFAAGLAPNGGGAARSLGDVVAGPFDVQSGPFDDRCLGVEHAWDHFWVTGRGHSSVLDDWMVHQYDLDGLYIASYPQNLAPGYSGWGGRDLEADQSAFLLWQGNDDGRVEEYVYDPISGGLTAGARYSTAVPNTVRGLCRDPSTGHFFTKSFTADLFEFDLATGVIVNRFANSTVSAYGLAWDPNAGTVWANDTNASVQELDAATGVATGRAFQTALGGLPGGLDYYEDSRNPNGATLVQLHQESLDRIVAYDAADLPPPPPPEWPNLPTAFEPANGYLEDFERLLGVVPPHMAINELNALTAMPDAEAWCNLGQRAPCLNPEQGAYCIEMGLAPYSSNYHDVRNGLVLGLNGLSAGDLTMDFRMIDYGEESDPWDGVWISADGASWEAVLSDWSPVPNGNWIAVDDVALSATSVDTNGPFYLLFAQEDDFPLGVLDGVQIDEISITGNGTGPVLEIQNLIAGRTAFLRVSGATPNGIVRVGWSVAGPGPTSTAFGDVLLSPPIGVIAGLADPLGVYVENQPVPSGASGATLWLHAVDAGSGILTNALAEPIG